MQRLPDVWRLSIWDSTGVDLHQMGPVPRLHTIELYRSLVTDLSPLADRDMRRLAIWGCPLEPRWYDWLREQWARGVAGEKPKTFPESTWRLCRKFHDRGLGLVAFRDKFGEDRICLAGKHKGDHGLAVLPEEEIDELLARHPEASTPEMMRILRARFHELVPQLKLKPKPKSASD